MNNNTSKDITYENEPLFHYTSLNTLKSIIENKTIRFTDYKFLNDPKELSLGLSYLKEFLFKVKNGLELHNNINAKLNAEEAIKSINTDNDIYAISFSKKRDDLAMWNLYGKDGVCIKFNSNEFFKYLYVFRDYFFNTFKTIELKNILRGPVNYNKNIFDSVSKIMISKLPKDFFTLNYDLLYQHCLLYKTSAWEYENEYRCAFIIPNYVLENNNCCHKAKKIFVNNKSLLKPQIEFGDLPIDKIIEEVIISPYLDNELVKLGLEKFFEEYRLNPKIIKKSSISIRRF